MSNVRETATALAATLDEMTQRIARAAERLERLDATAERVERRLARGTLNGETFARAAEATPAKRTVTRRTRKPSAFFVGDTSPTSVLNETVERLIRARPGITRAELMDATGCTNVNRVAGAIIHLQRNGTPIVNLGTRRLGRWAIAVETKP